MKNNISLFYPYVTPKMKQAVNAALSQKMITHGETVKELKQAKPQSPKRRIIKPGSSALELHIIC
jgi:dTDP-4-amino-4,6-dideoxygalactose transaminase